MQQRAREGLNNYNASSLFRTSVYILFSSPLWFAPASLALSVIKDICKLQSRSGEFESKTAVPMSVSRILFQDRLELQRKEEERREEA